MCINMMYIYIELISYIKMCSIQLTVVIIGQQYNIICTTVLLHY